MTPIAIWGGVECTVNRVHGVFFDQLARSGHATRPSDLDRFAALGIRTLRYPVLWERVAPRGLAQADWTWTDERLLALRDRGIRPIVGLVHHGSGPQATDLLQPAFAARLSEFAAAVADRHPWVDAYTPVNEPLTTARFSALYGHWYPHHRDDRSFVAALLHQTLAIRDAMEAVRRVNPAAALIQTEDIGLASSTPRLAYQADFENERRWLSLDLLAGRVIEGHPLMSYLQSARADERVLADLAGDPCPPDVIGLNYYLTSDRFLDHRVARYPAALVGGNGRDRYVDTEAVRVPRAGIAGHEAHLLAAWRRYSRPLALTEVHAACSREEQVRWLLEAWRGAAAARRRGADVVAITAWALLGSYDWDSLVTCDRGTYEPGAFDVRAPEPRPTLLATIVSRLARQQPIEHPLLEGRGWWRRPQRHRGVTPVRARARASKRARLLITGRTGTLGQAFALACQIRGLRHALVSRQSMDIANAASVARAIARHRPWAIVNAAGFVDVDRAEREPSRCFRENTEGPSVLAGACRAAGIRLVTFSSDLVFDGGAPSPYLESAPAMPLSVYGRSKMEAEAQVLARLGETLIIRTSAFFGPVDDFNFVTRALRQLAAGRCAPAATDVVITPTYVPELVDRTLDLLLDGEGGVWHLANADAVSWADLARLAADRAGLPARLIRPVPAATLGWTAARPAYSALGSERGTLMQPLEAALACYCANVQPGFDNAA